MDFNRRQLLKTLGLGAVAINLPVYALQNLTHGIPRSTRIPLLEPDSNDLMLPEGFKSRILAETNNKVPGTDYKWHFAPDGGAVVETNDGGWIYVSNAESFWSFSNTRGGGAGALRFDSQGEIIDAYELLTGTIANCAGGLTPWGTWLSCEEFDTYRINQNEEVENDFYISPDRNLRAGLVWETYPLEKGKEAIAHPTMGAFQHEAAAFDDQGYVYLTEDQKDGCFYRYSPNTHGDLSSGKLEVAVMDNENQVTWREILDPILDNKIPTREQVPEATRFKGGEGCAFHDDVIYFSTKRDNKVWAYDTRSLTIMQIYQPPQKGEEKILSGVDNLAITPSGQLLVAEDGGNMELVLLNTNGEAVPILRVANQDDSEITGPAFSPDGQRLYFSSQRGRSGKPKNGITYEVTGPFETLIV